MQIQAALLVTLGLFASSACTRQEMNRETRKTDEVIQKDTESPAHKAGRAAHEIADETKEAARKAGAKLREAGREAREGWRDAKQEDRDAVRNRSDDDRRKP
jgi:hypothetical protein